MTHPYTPVPTVLPATITEPVDGEPRTVASFTQMTRALADAIAYISTHLSNEIVDFTSTGQWTCPVGVTSAEIEYWGGGAGGGFGCDGIVGTDSYALSGAGGGAPLRQKRRVVVIPGTVYDITIGAGGTAGARTATPAGDGGDTIFAIHLGAEIARASGSRAGSSVQDSTTDIDGTATTDSFFALGGGPVKGDPIVGFTDVVTGVTTSFANTLAHAPYNLPGVGGDGVTVKNSSRNGQNSLEGYTGGAGGTNGTTASGARGGGGGGGGAAGPGGNGGAGGNGGNGATGGGGGGSASAATAGTAAAANSGAGGGGGGGGGCSAAATPSHGAAGAAGGSGFLRLSYVKVV